MENTASLFDSQTSHRATDTKSESQLCLIENAPLKNAGVGLVQRKTQSAALLRLLIDAHGSWVPLPEILKLGVAQYGAPLQLYHHPVNKFVAHDGNRRIGLGGTDTAEATGRARGHRRRP